MLDPSADEISRKYAAADTAALQAPRFRKWNVGVEGEVLLIAASPNPGPRRFSSGSTLKGRSW